MANHPNRSTDRAYVILRGDTLTAGYIDDRGTRSIAVRMIDGVAYEYDRDRGCAMTWESPLLLDSEGEIVRAGAIAGYGFLPDDGEIERVAHLGVSFGNAT